MKIIQTPASANTPLRCGEDSDVDDHVVVEDDDDDDDRQRCLESQ